ncbi:MAG TPA: hypothetical protein DCP51_03635 [Clostridiales bacterium]|nr:hypothetical protein [Clostridiales bacterium]
MNKIYFSKVFKGYSPEEVEAFIIKLNNDLHQKQQEFSDTTKRLNSELSELKKHFDEVISQKEVLTEENRTLCIEKQNLQNEIKRLSAEKTERPVVQAVIETDINKMNYKQLCEQLGEKMLIADLRADEIIKNAKQEANVILFKAESNAGDEINRLVAEANKRIELVYNAIDEFGKKHIFINAGLDQVQKYISDAIREVEALISTNKSVQ